MAVKVLRVLVDDALRTALQQAARATACTMSPALVVRQLERVLYATASKQQQLELLREVSCRDIELVSAAYLAD